MVERFIEIPLFSESFWAYLGSSSTRIAVLGPGSASLAILLIYWYRGGISSRLQVMWVAAVLISFYCTRWDETGDMRALYIFSAFSVASVLLLFNRLYIPPLLAYALTFLSLWSVDMMHAFCHSLEAGESLASFYNGVGGAGATDALLLVPVVTALFVSYAAARVHQRGESLQPI
jgi:hypothetical protein